MKKKINDLKLNCGAVYIYSWIQVIPKFSQLTLNEISKKLNDNFFDKGPSMG